MKTAITGMSVHDAYNAFDVSLLELHPMVAAKRVDELFELPKPDHPVAAALVIPPKNASTNALVDTFKLSAKEANRLSVKHQRALLTALTAAQQAGAIETDHLKRSALVVADSPRNTELQDLIHSGLSGKRVNPYALLSFRPDYLVDYIGSMFGVTGPGFAITASCASGAYALDHAVKLIEAGEVDSALVLSMSTELSAEEAFFFHSLGAMSSDPARHCRPFDVNRKGLVLAGGCAAVYVESISSARARGVAPLAIIEGIGTSSDGEHLTAPATDHAGAKRALDTCLKDFQGEVDYILAHAAGTPVGDLREVEFLSKHFPGTATASLKGHLGHHVHNSTLVELCYAVECLRQGMMAPTAHLNQPIDGDLNFIRGWTMRELRTILKPSFGFGGKNGIVLLSKPGL